MFFLFRKIFNFNCYCYANAITQEKQILQESCCFLQKNSQLRHFQIGHPAERQVQQTDSTATAFACLTG